MKSIDRIRKLAEQLKIELQPMGTDAFWLQQGSTFVHISFDVINKEENLEMVCIWSRVVIAPKVDDLLLKKLMMLNANLNFGSFGLTEDNVIIYKYNILGGDHVDSEEFFNALFMVATIADEYDNKIISTHGGQTAVDFLDAEMATRDSQRRALPW
ncbi:MAG TPA: YbjN domain-containing protein [Leptospiraceae bacterium]|jgi:hypothetical protein|nr:YbjN domain-containing protein [Leptospiraceae bacterium]